MTELKFSTEALIVAAQEQIHHQINQAERSATLDMTEGADCAEKPQKLPNAW